MTTDMNIEDTNSNRKYHHHLMNRINESLVRKDDAFLLTVYNFIRETEGRDVYLEINNNA
jgi:hypothetical protein